MDDLSAISISNLGSVRKDVELLTFTNSLDNNQFNFSSRFQYLYSIFQNLGEKKNYDDFQQDFCSKEFKITLSSKRINQLLTLYADLYVWKVFYCRRQNDITDSRCLWNFKTWKIWVTWHKFLLRLRGSRQTTKGTAQGSTQTNRRKPQTCQRRHETIQRIPQRIKKKLKHARGEDIKRREKSTKYWDEILKKRQKKLMRFCFIFRNGCCLVFCICFLAYFREAQ